LNIRANSIFKAGDFARLESYIVPKIIAAVDQATAAVLQSSLANVPVDTGELASSGGTETVWKGRAVNGYVTYTSPHASFVEFGTGIIGSRTYPYPLPQEGIPFTDSWIYDYKRQNWQGMSAQPYLRPALDQSRDAIMQAFTSQGLAAA
jgi:hypothetical protein